MPTLSVHTCMQISLSRTHELRRVTGSTRSNERRRKMVGREQILGKNYNCKIGHFDIFTSVIKMGHLEWHEYVLYIV